jgi:hypothetical protein
MRLTVLIALLLLGLLALISLQIESPTVVMCDPHTALPWMRCSQ